MSDKTPQDLARQLAQHAASLRGAGVEWVPLAEPLPPPVVVAPAPLLLASSLSGKPDDSAAVQTGLFAAVASDTPVSDGDSRRQELKLLAEQVACCTRCKALASTRTQTVFGVGPIDPELCFVGEAPGADEDRQGLPFVGPAGQLLTRIIVAMGLKREEVYICNILRCRPPGNRQPEAEEAANCNEWLVKTLDQVRPKIICVLGNTAIRFLLGVGEGVNRIHGRFFDWRGTPVMATFHPSYLLRSPEKKKEAWEDMKVLLKRMGRPIPGKG